MPVAVFTSLPTVDKNTAHWHITSLSRGYWWQKGQIVHQ